MIKIKTRWWLLSGTIILLLLCLLFVYPMAKLYMNARETLLNNNLYLMSGGGNSGILITEKAVVVIDTKMGSTARKLYKRARELAGDKPLLIINTHLHGDHVNGNRLYPESDKFMGAYDTVFLKSQVSEENMPQLLVEDSLVLDLGDELVVLRNMHRGHTWDDLIVYLPYHRIVFTGDLVFNHLHPPFFKEAGSSAVDWLHALKMMKSEYDPLMVVPGHGEPGGIELIESMQTYFSDMIAAADNPSERNNMNLKYKDWFRIPFMSSTNKTIEFILQGKEQ